MYHLVLTEEANGWWVVYTRVRQRCTVTWAATWRSAWAALEREADRCGHPHDFYDLVPAGRIFQDGIQEEGASCR